MLYILLGEDSFSINRALEAIKGEMGDPTLLSANTTDLEGQQLTLSQLQNACETVPFLAQRRLVIIRGLLERFEPRDRASRGRKKTTANNHPDGYTALAAYVRQIPNSTVLVLIDGRIGNANPLLKEISAGGKVRSFPLLRGDKLRQWVQERVSEKGGKIATRAADLLSKLVGGNLWTMDSEIEKLVLFTSGRRIEEEDVRLITSQGQESSVFAMVDAIFELRAKTAEQILQQLLQRGASPTYLLAMLSRQVHMIVRAGELKSRAESELEIQNRLGLKGDFALRKTLEQASRYPLGQLKKMYHKLLETDLSIKTGQCEGELALTILLAELCQRH